MRLDNPACGFSPWSECRTLKLVHTEDTSSKPVACNDVIEQGATVGSAVVINMGKTSGNIGLTIQTYEVADQLSFYCTDQWPGGKAFWTLGCQSTFDPWNIALAFDCPTSKIVGVLEPNCNQHPYTEWIYAVSCP